MAHNLEARILEAFSQDQYYGGIGQLEERLLEFREGPPNRQLATLQTLIESDAANNIKMGIATAGLSIFAETPQATDKMLQDIYDVAFVTPRTARYNPLDLGKKTDEAQRNEMKARTAANAVRSLREIFEQNSGNPHTVFDTLRGDGLNEISRMGKADLIKLLSSSGIASGSIILSGIVCNLINLEGGNPVTAAGVLAGIASGVNYWRTSRLLDIRKMKVMPHLIKSYPDMLPLIPSIYDLHSRRILQQYAGNQSPADAVNAAQSIYELPQHLKHNPVVTGNISLGILSAAERDAFTKPLITTSNGHLKPLWQILTMGRALETEFNLNRITNGETTLNHLPLIGPEQAHLLPALVKEIGGTRLTAMKKAIAPMHESTDIPTNELHRRIDDAKRSIRSTTNKQAPHVTLSLAFPLKQNLQHIAASDPKRRTSDEVKNHDDFIYFKEAGQNYGGMGISDRLIATYWEMEPQQEYGNRFFMEHYKTILLRAPRPKQLAPIKDIPLSTWEGINGNNSWGKLLTTILTAAHYDPTNPDVGDGYVRIVNQATDLLTEQATRNPAAVYDILMTVAAQTDALVNGNLWLEKLYEQHPNWRIVDESQQIDPDDISRRTHIDKGLHMIETALHNIGTVRKHAVSGLMNYLTKDAAVAIREKKVTEQDKLRMDTEKYFETDYPYSSLYTTIVMLTREAPDLVEEITAPLKTILINSGVHTTAAPLSYEFLYTLGFLKSYTQDAQIPEEYKQKFLTTYENIVKELTTHSFANFNRVERGDFGREYIRVAANYYKDCLNTLNDESFLAHMTHVNGLNGLLESIISDKSVEGIDWRPINKTSSRQEVLDILLATAEDTVREFNSRIEINTDPAQKEQLIEAKKTLDAQITQINERKESMRSGANRRNDRQS